MSDCICKVCEPLYEYMAVCGLCGNKRCPRITYHGHACTKSNDTGQVGSSYGSVLCGESGCACIALNARYERESIELQGAFPDLFVNKKAE